MKLYRDLRAGETLQFGDERQTSNGVWVPFEAVWIGQPVPEDLRWCFRRPVNLPVLQPVTPEAMAELEGRAAVGVVMITPYNEAGDNIVRVMSFVAGKWGHYRDGWKADVSRPSVGWFIDLTTIPEVQQ